MFRSYYFLFSSYYFQSLFVFSKKCIESSREQSSKTFSKGGASFTFKSFKSGDSKKNANVNKSVIVCLHGLGDTGDSYVEPMKLLINKCGIEEAVILTAPKKNVTVLGGMETRSWFDVLSFNPDDAEDKNGILKMASCLSDFIMEYLVNERGFEFQNIYLFGFSLGGAMCLSTLVSIERRLAGCIVMSGYLPLRDHVANLESREGKSTSILFIHGELDNVVPCLYAKMSKDILLSSCSYKDVQLITLPNAGHSCSQLAMIAVCAFVNKKQQSKLVEIP